ncbi:hypothetical protein FQR65_LT03198 [Abscondita terminalis]|nr:hypothetical protein FQR65_LT03198 [Abscondita terminalis]
MRNRYEAPTFESDPLDGSNNFILSLLLLPVALKIFNGFLPTPLQVIDEKDNPDAFIAERAIHDLKMLTSLGPRVVGSYENEALAINFFKREIAFIEQRLHPNQKLEIDFQTVTGSYFMDYKPNGAIHAYSKLQNIIVKLHGKSSAHSLLLNSHFDTVPTSPGGSDDGINCAIMLEILRKLSRSPERLQHNVVFLFNGAEEAGLKAAHGFIMNHKWVEEVRAVINLEAGGAGGKEYLFQTSTKQPWILNYYKQLPHPNAHVIGEEFFQSGIIPSDTDYRIFRDFRNVSGLDFAFVDDGYRYHTKHDGFSNIFPGTYQHTGDNILKLTKLMGDAVELPNSEEFAEKSVFYDFFGFFLISYTESLAILINIGVSVISVALAIRAFLNFGVGTTRQSIWYILTMFGFVLLGWMLSGVVVVLTGLIIDVLKSTMSWYGHPVFVIGLYVMPLLLVAADLSYFATITINLIAAQTQLQIHTIRLVWTLLLLTGTYFGIRSIAILLIPILFQTATFIAIHLLGLQYSVRKWQIFFLVGTLISVLYVMNVFQMLASVLIPVCGRIGSDKNPEFIIGVYTSLSTIVTFSHYTPFITIVNKNSSVVKFLFGVFLITILLITVTPLGFPYSGDPQAPTPQRFWIYVSITTLYYITIKYLKHTSRTFHNDSNHVAKTNSGFFILNWDRNSPYSVKNHVKSLSRIKPIEDDCNEALFCGLPLISSRVVGIMRESAWIPAGQPIIHEPTNLKLISKIQISKTIVRFNFSATGPSHINIVVSARQNAKFIATSLVDKLPSNVIMWNDKPTYVILHTWGLESTPLLFTLDFEVLTNLEEKILDIAISGRCMHDRTNVKTPQFVQFLNEFPEWADVAPYLATYESWVY